MMGVPGVWADCSTCMRVGGLEAASPSRVRTTPHRSGREIAPNDLPVCLYAGVRARCSARCVTGSAVVSGCVTLTVTLTLCVCVSEPPHTPLPTATGVKRPVQGPVSVQGRTTVLRSAYT